jgi:hypothetical protein
MRFRVSSGVLSSLTGLCILLLASGCGSQPMPAAPSPIAPIPATAAFEFSASPIVLTSFSSVFSPGYDWVGSMSSSMAFQEVWGSDAVFAPAPGVVTTIGSDSDGVRMDFLGNQGMRFYLSGLAEATVTIGSRLEAGERVGTRQREADRFGRLFAVRLGLMNPAARLNLITPLRYPDEVRLGENPLRYFVEPLRSQILGLRGGPDADSRLDYDVPGTLMGLWFEESVPFSDSLSSASRDKRLWIVFTNSTGNGGFGGQTLRISALSNGLLPMTTPVQGSPHPRDITPQSGFLILQMERSPYAPSWPVLLLVQMLSESRVRAEGYGGPADGAPTSFTAKARTFIR